MVTGVRVVVDDPDDPDEQAARPMVSAVAMAKAARRFERMDSPRNVVAERYRRPSDRGWSQRILGADPP
jgi:hypothetical protein